MGALTVGGALRARCPVCRSELRRSRSAHALRAPHHPAESRRPGAQRAAGATPPSPPPLPPATHRHLLHHCVVVRQPRLQNWHDVTLLLALASRWPHSFDSQRQLVWGLPALNGGWRSVAWQCAPMKEQARGICSALRHVHHGFGHTVSVHTW